jgi:GT2 family glycosyltransferase
MNGSILCITRNNLALSKRAIKSAAEQDVPYDIMVIDNASTDGTQQWLGVKTVATVLLQAQESLAACWNRGLKAFWNIGAREVLVINNDVILRPDTYRLLVSCQEPFITGVSVNCPHQLGNAGDRSPQELVQKARPHPDFSCAMITKHVWDRVGPFDEKYYPAYGEDADYHVRMHKAGITALCVDVPFYHEGSATLKNSDPAEGFTIRRGADINREYFFHKWKVRIGTPEYYSLFESATPKSTQS